MNEPPRLHTEPESELERSLLDAGRSYTASASSRTKALAALGIVGVTASSTTAASAITKGGIVKWLAATVLLAGAAVPAVHYLKQRATGPVSTEAAASASAAAPVAAAPALVSAAVAPSAPLAVDSVSAPVEAAPSMGSSSAHSDAKAAAPAALSAELSALDTARSALASNDATGALADLDAYARNFPHGKLSLEAEVLRIDALAKSGQPAAAKKRAEAFIKRHPGSVLASRVRAYAGQ